MPRIAARGSRRVIRAGALGAVVGVALVLVLRAGVAEVRGIESGSMSPTLRAGERVLVTKAGVDRWQVPRGSVVVFDAADLWADAADPSGSVFVKRVVGIGGDRIVCCTIGGLLQRNGRTLAEPYLEGNRSDQQEFDVIVPAAHYWVMGDNRADSSDSRAHLGHPGGGNVPASRIIGTVGVVVWPPGAVRQLEAAHG